MKQHGSHAVVIGASIGGVLAARVLTDSYDTVTILERDAFPEPGEQRKGVPQAKHAHGLHARGREIMESLFPDFTNNMVAQGGMVLDISRDFRWYANGGFHQPTVSGLSGLLVSRARLEAGLRAHLLTIPNVHAIENCDVVGIVASEDRRRVTGVRMVRRGVDPAEEILSSDLVVDASGRGSRSPAWLKSLGYQPPPEEQVRVHLGYTSCEYRRRPDQLPGHRGMAIAAEPPQGRIGVVLAAEGDRWHITVGGYNGDFAPLNQQGMLEFARGLPTPEIYEVLKDAEPIGEPVGYKFAANLRRRYEQLTQFPEGLLVFGDALCSFNPVYAQGMTVAALEATVLRDALSAGTQTLAPRFFKVASSVLDGPWSVAVGNDLRFPHVEGKRTPMGQILNWYVGKLHIAARQDASLSVTFLRVVNMMAPPTSLLHPRIMIRILKGNVRAEPAKQPAATSAAPIPAGG